MNKEHKTEDCCHQTEAEQKAAIDATARAEQKSKVDLWKILAVVFMALFGLSLVLSSNLKDVIADRLENYQTQKMHEAVLPAEGIDLPVAWGDLGLQLVEAGVIDLAKFEKLYSQRKDLGQVARSLLNENKGSSLKMTHDNASVLLNLFWAFGLSNKNTILEQGPMTDARYGGDAGRFASTAGWTLAAGSAMSHYSKHEFISLTSEQQLLVEEVSSNIYRPCCGNSVYFPDCNHGMAMLGLLQLMAANGMGEEEMYDIALKVNSYWFPDTYLTIAKYQREKLGKNWEDVDAKEVLGAAFSSSSGYQGILNEITPPTSAGGPSCGV